MRPCSCARRPTDAHMSSRTHPRAHTYIHPCTRTYARIRAREGIFLTTKLLYNIAKPSSIISPTPFTSIIQSLYNPIYIGTSIATLSVQTDIICHSFSTHLPFISNYLPTIHHHSSISITHLSIYIPFIITTSHHLNKPIRISYSIFI